VVQYLPVGHFNSYRPVRHFEIIALRYKGQGGENIFIAFIARKRED